MNIDAEIKLFKSDATSTIPEGMGTELYIHNLFIGERQFAASTAEPLYYFKPRWISDTELEYTMSSGEKKIYKIQK